MADKMRKVFIGRVVKKIGQNKAECYSLANTTMVQSNTDEIDESACDFTHDGQSFNTSRHGCTVSFEELGSPDGTSIVRSQFQKRGILNKQLDPVGIMEVRNQETI
ncbi:uncharacterized protein LOC130054141 [Ostrea edulis]|uniref:uncharacterized protein LOC130054141 n=1 Tax=Ostrea edulis TaxID=37623 RepID=UPI0024AE98DB|nr:uncharacterized protein LOC130054141 [Ostrea edulis]